MNTDWMYHAHFQQEPEDMSAESEQCCQERDALRNRLEKVANDLVTANHKIDFLLSRLREFQELNDALRVIFKHMQED